MRSIIILFIALLSILVCPPTIAFNLPGLTNIFKPQTPTQTSSNSNSIANNNDEQLLLNAVSNTSNGKNADIETQSRVLSIVRRLETKSTPSSTLLSNPQESQQQLDGVWYLQYTAPSEIEGLDLNDDKWVAIDASEDKNIETKQFKKAGSVSGGGIPVSNSGAQQIFDIANTRVTNKVTTKLGLVTVGGTFRQSTKVPLRAIVAFDTAKLELNVGPTIDLSFLFDIRAVVQNGDKESGWLETTYLSGDVRIGRGNKGSMFVLTRDADAVTP